MAPKKAEVGKKAEVPQELSPSALELLLPIWNAATLPQDDKGSQGSKYLLLQVIRRCT